MRRRSFRIGLLRHGETEGGARYRGVTDDPLTTTGWEQMWRATSMENRWDGIVTSPLRRCAQFAYAFAQQHALHVHVDERLRELDFGRWEGRTAVDILKTEPEALSLFWRDPWNHSPPDGESLPALQARVLAAWNDLAMQGRSVLVIAHGGPLRVILCHTQRKSMEEFFAIDVPYAVLRRVEVTMPEAALSESTT